MADGYRIIGAEMSPYSVKVRSYFRYKGIPFQWIPRNAASQAEFEKHAKMPIIPLVVTPVLASRIPHRSSTISRGLIPSHRFIPPNR
jgi:hypothetical protein